MAKNQTTKRIEQRLEEYRIELGGVETMIESQRNKQARIVGKIEALEDVLKDESPED